MESFEKLLISITILILITIPQTIPISHKRNYSRRKTWYYENNTFADQFQIHCYNQSTPCQNLEFNLIKKSTGILMSLIISYHPFWRNYRLKFTTEECWLTFIQYGKTCSKFGIKEPNAIEGDNVASASLIWQL